MNENNQTPRDEFSPSSPVENPATSAEIPTVPLQNEGPVQSGAPLQNEIPPQQPAASYQTTPPPYGYAPYGEPTPPKKPKKSKTPVVIAVCVAAYLLLTLGMLAMIVVGALKAPEKTDPSPSETEEAVTDEGKGDKDKPSNPAIKEDADDEDNPIVGEDYSGDRLTASELYEKNVNSVVFVESNYARGQATGSGFVIDAENGYILTNYHVVEECDDIAVTFLNEDSYTAKLIGGDEINDVAVLKIEAKNLQNVTIGNSDKIKIGDDLLVIGNPLGDLTFTLTKGIISGTDREINTGEYNINTFQTDAAINSGNSGGPAFDATGAVVGIASAKYAASGVEGIGFCIPINDAMEIARDLVDYGYVTGRPNFGITVSDSTGYEYTTDEWGRRVIVETMPGARVEEVGKDSCAEKAGLKKGDVITKLNETKIETANDLINAKNTHRAGDTVTIEIYRDGKTMTLTAVLDEYTPE